MKRRFLVLGMLVCVSFIAMVVGVYIAYGASMLALTDNTLVTDDSMLRCLAQSGQKALVLTGSTNDPFRVYEDGVLVTTITLATASEKYSFDHVAGTYKIDWTTTATAADTATLYCQ